MRPIVILGTAHLSTTPGKRSPDGRLMEYAYSREIVGMIENRLKGLGYTVYVDYEATEPNAQMKGSTWRIEQNNELKYRCGVVNKICDKHGVRNCVYVSVHVNAAGSGQWKTASGVSVYVCPSASASAKKLAQYYTANAIRMGLTGNRSIPTTKYWTANYYVLKSTKCPAILTENMFQDNKDDVDFLLSDEGKKEIVELHVKAIEQYSG